MMNRFFIVIAFLLGAFLASGQNSVSGKKDNESPQTALIQARKDFRQAVKDKNSPLLIQSLIRQLNYQSAIDLDSFPPMLQRVEEFILTTPNVVEKSILHSLMAELYQVYYQNNSSELSGRTPITGYIPKEMKAWTGNIYIEKIVQHALDAVKAQAQLSTENCLSYKEILILGKNSPALRPTLYDFLVYRSIDILGSIWNAAQYFKQTPLTDARLFAPAEEFVQMTIKHPAQDIQPNIARLYQLLLQAQMAAKRPDALLISDLDRLEFIQRTIDVLDRNSLYQTSLERLNQKYHSNPYRVEVLYKMAQSYETPSYPFGQRNSSVLSSDYQRALQWCDEGIRQFPNYFRINILKELAAEIKQPNANYTIKTNVYPGEDQTVQLNFKNISNVTFVLYRIKESSLQFLNSNKQDLTQEQISSFTYKLPQSLLNQDTAFQIPVQEPGLYALAIRTAGQTKQVGPLYFNSSRLSSIARRTGEKDYDFLTCDLLSGKPIEGAKVRFYRRVFNGNDRASRQPSYRFLSETSSDADGIAFIKNLEQDVFYQVILGNDDHGTLNQIFFQYFNPTNPPTKQEDIFTDRAVYRPGQTIYFNGISWTATPSGSKANANMEYTVTLLDANQQSIAKKKLTSNAYGSFTGSFVLPQEVLTGNFTILAGNARHSITVAEYKRPKFEITFNPIKQAYKLGDRLTISGDVKSYAGVSIENSNVSYSIQENTFGGWSYRQTPISAGTTRTDANGGFHITFDTPQTPVDPNGISPRMLNYRYLITVSVTAPNGETQESQYPVNITNQRYWLSTGFSSQVNKENLVKIPIFTSNGNGYKLKEEITYTLSSLQPLRAIETEYDMENIPVEKEILQGTFTTGSEKELELNLSSYPSGAYLLSVSGIGTNEEITSKRIIYLYSPQDKHPPYLTYNWIVREKTTCAPGEEAKIILGSSAKEVYVLYEIYTKGQFMERKRIRLNDECTTLSIPYLKNYGTTAELIISYVKDGKIFNNYIGLTREEADRHLDIITKTFRDHLVPGQQEEWSFTIKNAKGEPTIAEMMAGMYDASLDYFQKNTWFFNPIYNDWTNLPQWSFRDSPTNGYLNFFDRTHAFPSFQYDRLNLYELPTSLSPVRYRMAFAEQNTTRVFSQKTASYTTINDEAVFRLAENEVKEVAATAGSGLQETTAPQIRQNFQETAFFYPQLLSDSTGNMILKFTVPEATTTWRFMALAHTRDMQFGQINKPVITRKEFMVSTNLPRFVRTGDHVVFQATINNLTGKDQQGDAYLELFIPATEKIISKQVVPFNVSAQQNQTVSFEFTAPQDMDLLGCRIVAEAEHFSDGEQHVLPVIPNATLVTQTLPIFTTRQGQQAFQMKIPKGVTPYRFTLELTANPIWYAVLALPTVNTPQTENVTEITASYYVSSLATAIASANPQITSAIKTWSQKPTPAQTSPLEKNQELKSILLQLSPWVTEAQNETEQMHALGELLDVNRQNYIHQQSINKLAELQNPDGGWSWFKGFSSSPFMTENVLEAMSRLTAAGATEHPEQVKRMQINALKFLDETIEDTYKHVKTAGYAEILYLYTRSAYRDIPLTNALEAHKYYLTQLEKSWSDRSLYEKALTAMALYRYGKTETARQIVHSLKEYATTTPEMGMFWANNRSTLFTNSAIQTHVALMSAFHEITGDTQDTERMKQWLLRQKQTQNWGSTPTTVDAIYALLLTGYTQLSVQEDLSVKLGNTPLPLTPEESRLGYIKQSFSDKEITPKMTNLTLTKNTNQASWGGLYMQYFEKLDKITSHSEGISVQKKLFIEKDGGHGNTLIPLEGQRLKVGDKVNIRITVQTDQDMQYVHLKDLRAGCFEPTEQLSGNRWQSTILYYQETADVATNFFFDFLPKGTYVFEYTVWIAQSGTYQDGITTLQCIYAPQYSANSAAGSISVQ